MEERQRFSPITRLPVSSMAGQDLKPTYLQSSYYTEEVGLLFLSGCKCGLSAGMPRLRWILEANAQRLQNSPMKRDVSVSTMTSSENIALGSSMLAR